MNQRVLLLADFDIHGVRFLFVRNLAVVVNVGEDTLTVSDDDTGVTAEGGDWESLIDAIHESIYALWKDGDERVLRHFNA
jgi:hypothetical protein